MSLIAPVIEIADATVPATETVGVPIAAVEAQLYMVGEIKRQHSKAMSALDSEAAQLIEELATSSEAQAALRASLVISGHALMRWLERQYGMDIEPYRGETAGILSQAIASGASDLKTSDGVSKLRDGYATTYIDLGFAA